TKAKIVLSKLGIRDFAAKVGTLSGGQQKRVALARALLDSADLLILDEPTNHIDAETITWLEKYLASEVAALLMVTHDRYFLDRVANQIVELDRRELVKYPGNYTAYLEKRAQRHELLSKQEEKRRGQLRRELEWLRRSPTARGTKQKARKQRAQELMTLHYDRNDDRVAMILAGRRLGKRVLEAKNLSLAYDGVPLFAGVDFSLGQGERIGIVGPNGAGKSSLLNLLAGKLHSATGSIAWGETVVLGYYDQLAARLDDQMLVIDFIAREIPLIMTESGERVEAAQMLQWFLFSRPEQRAQIGSLSGGERRRLYLLSVLMHQPNVLFLDEPTNDLDIQTLQVLEQFLDNFKGSLVVVSHDRYFLDRNVDLIYVFNENGIGSRYPSPYRAEISNRQTVEPTNQPTDKLTNRHTEKPKTKLSWKQQRELERLEGEIERLEKEKVRLEGALNVVGGDYVKLGVISAELDAINEQLDEVEMRWLELQED
ncbi:MAG TPA: ABC transporter ATP-binding protein, partial [Anaerolineae bacterium]|nr:ABC transporter ATP-binding protein [Anaerolineae bacterium]